MKFRARLTAHGYTTDQVSASLKRKIKQYEKLEAGITEAEESLDDVNLSKTKRKQITERLEVAKQELLQLDQEIAEGIDRYKRNEATYKNAGKKLNDGKKKNNPDPSPDPDPAPAPAPDPSPDPDPAPAPDPKDKKKKGFAGLIIGSLVAIALGAIGYSAYKNNS